MVLKWTVFHSKQEYVCHLTTSLQLEVHSVTTKGQCLLFKGIVHPKMKVLSSFNLLVPNP